MADMGGNSRVPATLVCTKVPRGWHYVQESGCTSGTPESFKEAFRFRWDKFVPVGKQWKLVPAHEVGLEWHCQSTVNYAKPGDGYSVLIVED